MLFSSSCIWLSFFRLFFLLFFFAYTPSVRSSGGNCVMWFAPIESPQIFFCSRWMPSVFRTWIMESKLNKSIMMLKTTFHIDINCRRMPNICDICEFSGRRFRWDPSNLITIYVTLPSVKVAKYIVIEYNTHNKITWNEYHFYHSSISPPIYTHTRRDKHEKTQTHSRTRTHIN